MSDTPLRPSGFGLVTRHICQRLAQRGHAVTILGWWDAGTGSDFEGIPVLPCPVAPAEASEALMQTVAAFRPDVLVTLGDIPWVGYVARQPVRSHLDRYGTAWLPYYPVDGTLPDGTLPPDWLAILRQADLPIAMSRFGVEACMRSGVAAVLIPHGCDTRLFQPPVDKEAAKHRVGCVGRFVILSDARNHRRKLLPRLLDIVRLFGAAKNDVVLLLNANHPAQDDTDVYSYDLVADIRTTGLDAVARLRKASGPAGLPSKEIAAMYAAADVHLLTSWGEGFGLPTLQAAATGVVSVGGGHSATKELLQDHGIAVQSEETALDEFGLVRNFIDRKLAAAALERLYADAPLRKKLGQAGRQFAQTLTWDAVAMQWEESLQTASLRRNRGAPLPTSRRHPARPTGHDAATLPLPRLTIPVHRPLMTLSGPRRLPMIVLVSAIYAPALHGLSVLFPGVAVRDGHDWAAEGEFRGDLAGVILVADPDRQLDPSLGNVCALAGVSFIGPSPYWTGVDEDGLMLQARKLLTDHPLAERRCAHALDLAKQACKRTLPVLPGARPFAVEPADPYV
jgi:glycosyltransferase involved in cell wall biosynthesis